MLPASNPFSTRYVRPGAMAYLFCDGHGPDAIVQRLAACSGRGAIVGPHGSGKSTMLETLRPRLVAAGWHVVAYTLHDGQRRLPLPGPPRGRTLVVVDGYEQLGWLSRWRWDRWVRRYRAGLLVTTHEHSSFPTVAETAPSLELVEQIVAELLAPSDDTITTADVRRAFAEQAGNVRETLFDLYDVYERRRRDREYKSACRAHTTRL